jgi:hypothetical protein
VVANKELLFQNKEKKKNSAAELVVANIEHFQNEEKVKRCSRINCLQEKVELYLDMAKWCFCVSNKMAIFS